MMDLNSYTAVFQGYFRFCLSCESVQAVPSFSFNVILYTAFFLSCGGAQEQGCGEPHT